MFNPATYVPADDSSQGFSVWHAVVIDRRDPATCHCGCGTPVKGKKALFAMGHDARFKGVLQRAHLSGTAVELVKLDADEFEVRDSRTALQVAADYNTERYSWTGALHTAKAKHDAKVAALTAKAEAKLAAVGVAKQQPKAVAEPEVVTAKVGRWEYQATIVARDESEVTVQYTDRKGATRTATVDAQLVR